MSAKEELTKLLMDSYDRGVEDAKQEALAALEKTVAVMVAAQLAQPEPLIPFRHGCKWCGKTDGCGHQQPAQQEPVGWWDDKLGFFAEKHFDQLQPVYKSPPQRTWVGLTDDEIEEVWKRVQANDFHDCVQPFARDIEAKLREKNT